MQEICKDQGTGETNTGYLAHPMGLVMVAGELHQVVDIGMRMLSPRELFRAQGFDETYIIDLDEAGKPLTKSDQVRMCGNLVPPALSAAMVAASCADMGVGANVIGDRPYRATALNGRTGVGR